MSCKAVISTAEEVKVANQKQICQPPINFAEKLEETKLITGAICKRKIEKSRHDFFFS